MVIVRSMITRRAFATTGLAAGLAFAGRPVHAARAARSVHPVVVELYTSQGCSSCPPADAFLGKLAQRPDIVALGFHIDYWDYIGWKDPFGDPAHTARQRLYAASLRKRTIYTPQMVIDGVVDAVGSRWSDVERKIKQRQTLGPAERISIPIHLTRAANGVLAVTVPKAVVPGYANLFLAAMDSRHVTPVPRGENTGRTLEDFNVVRSFSRIGRYDGSALAVEVDPSSWHQGTDRLALILQARDAGPVWGAVQLPL